MSQILPFKAIRPPAERAADVACVPYDVVYDDEVRELIGENPRSFLRVTRPEGEFSPSEDPSSHEVRSLARRNLDEFIEKGLLFEDDEEAIYVYQLQEGGHVQTGVVACCSVDEYDAGLIKKHEKTRPDKVEDRTEHMLAVGAQTGLIFLAFRETPVIRGLINNVVETEPLYSFKCPKGVGQKFWRITDTSAWVEAFAALPAIYIADGHHRAESAKLARDRRRDANPQHTGDEEYNFVVAGMFPAADLKILPYNRVVLDLNGLDSEGLLVKIGESFDVTEGADPSPANRGDISMYLGGDWYGLHLKPGVEAGSGPIETLDVSVLQNFLLSPILGIGDPRTDKRIAFIGGGRGTEELVRMVDEGEAAVAFSMFPTTMDDLFAVADRDEIMPPKSTWFEPKLKDGLVVHRI